MKPMTQRVKPSNLVFTVICENITKLHFTENQHQLRLAVAYLHIFIKRVNTLMCKTINIYNVNPFNQSAAACAQ